MSPAPRMGPQPGDVLRATLENLVGIQTPNVTKAENDLFHAWHEFANQAGPVATRRLGRATFYRTRLKRVVE